MPDIYEKMLNPCRPNSLYKSDDLRAATTQTAAWVNSPFGAGGVSQVTGSRVKILRTVCDVPNLFNCRGSHKTSICSVLVFTKTHRQALQNIKLQPTSCLPMDIGGGGGLSPLKYPLFKLLMVTGRANENGQTQTSKTTISNH